MEREKEEVGKRVEEYEKEIRHIQKEKEDYTNLINSKISKSFLEEDLYRLSYHQISR